jgi:hypothetical protein
VQQEKSALKALGDEGTLHDEATKGFGKIHSMLPANLGGEFSEKHRLRAGRSGDGRIISDSFQFGNCKKQGNCGRGIVHEMPMHVVSPMAKNDQARYRNDHPLEACPVFQSNLSSKTSEIVPPSC